MKKIYQILVTSSILILFSACNNTGAAVNKKDPSSMASFVTKSHMSQSESVNNFAASNADLIARASSK